MQDNQKKQRSLLSTRNLAFVILLALFSSLVIMAFPDALTGKVNEIDCIDGSAGCVADKTGFSKIALWGGVYLCSLLGLILMTMRSFRQNRGPTLYVGLASAAALNTLMWMAFVYAGAFLINLF